MAQRIVPQVIKTITKEGEIELVVKLELNINLNSDGLSVNPHVSSANKAEEVIEEEDEVHFPMPEFGPSKKIKNFGKKG